MNNDCTECNGDYDDSVSQGADGRWYLEVEGSDWDEWNDCIKTYWIEIQFCPFCGRRLVPYEG